jgi:hypothetical protein
MTIVSTIDVDVHPTFKRHHLHAKSNQYPPMHHNILILDLGKIDFVVPWIQTLVMVK